MKLKQVGPNQTELELDNGTHIFFSYETPVAAFVPGRGYVRTSTSYSVTTSRHINKWLDNRKAEKVAQATIDELAV